MGQKSQNTSPIIFLPKPLIVNVLLIIHQPLQSNTCDVHTPNYTEQKYKCNTFVFAPIFYEMNSKI